MEELIFVIAAVTVLYALVSERIQSSIITSPIVFTATGVLIALFGSRFIEEEFAKQVLEVIAELTLVVVLFIDASRIRLPLLVKDYKIPVRLLGIGLPLTIILGAIAAKLIFPELSVWEAALLSAILAPTDAALGQAVVSSPRVPEKIRQSLNVESGLNDGIVLPLVILCATLTGMESDSSVGSLLVYWGKQVTLGPLIGVLVGWVGGNLLERAKKTNWLSDSFRQLSGVALALLAWSGAILIGGNGFIAAFVAGMAISCHADHIGEAMQEFGEAEGQWLALATFLLFGLVSVVPAFEMIQIDFVIYIILSLTAIRMVPVALALIGLGFEKPTFWFIGWFGPRGLATLLFALLIVNKFDVVHGQQIFNIGVIAVVFSVVAHGLTAVPFSIWYSAALKKVCDEDSIERQPASDHRLKFSPEDSPNDTAN